MRLSFNPLRRAWAVVGLLLITGANCRDVAAESAAAHPEGAAAGPLLQWFTATPASVGPGQSTTLRWHVDDADTVQIDPGIGVVAASGTQNVSPVATTTYTLTAVRLGNVVSRSETVVRAPHPASAGGRYVAMVSPVGGQRFTAPAEVRVFAAAFDPGKGDGCGTTGTGQRCADRVDFYVDDDLRAQVPAHASEYWVFKAAFDGVAAGRHRVWSRAVYSNPALTLDSAPAWIEVDAAPAYASVIDLTQDVVLSGTQNYERIGSAGARIRINGNGHRIRSTGDWQGRLRLHHVDVFGLGPSGVPTPAIEVATRDAVELENTIFDSSGTIALAFSGAATASIRGNEFRSNMRMPQSQQPEFGSDASYPAIRISGGSSVAKIFQGNRIGVGWADFRNTSRWAIGGDAGDEGNVVLGPRAGLWVQNTTLSTVRGNLSYHIYFGGWSQGNNMELGGSTDLVVEHNVVGGGSWPIRGLEGLLRYNLVLDAGHQWLWIVGDGAEVHHNVFAGGEGDVAPVWLIYGPHDVQFYNNTLDGLGINSMTRPVWVGDEASATLRSNAIVQMPRAPAVQVDGTLDADHNLFSGQSGTPRNYSDNRAPANDVGGPNAQVAPMFSEAGEPQRYRYEDWWTRAVTARQVLANYRQRYTPAPGSPLIDAGHGSGAGDVILASSFEPGETGGPPGNDIGAVGAGQPTPDDLFGR